MIVSEAIENIGYCSTATVKQLHLYRFYVVLMLKELQLIIRCVNRTDRVKEQKLALPISPTVGSYNGRQLILQT